MLLYLYVYFSQGPGLFAICYLLGGPVSTLFGWEASHLAEPDS